MSPRHRLLARLLHLANAKPPEPREVLYALKDRLLTRHAVFVGHCWQELTYPCWDGPCGRCGGTGIYRQRWVLLEAWRWGRWSFHRPVASMEERPGTQVPMIQGRITHQDYGPWSWEACAWLYLLCGEWRAMERLLVHHSWRTPGVWPPMHGVCWGIARWRQGRAWWTGNAKDDGIPF